MKTSVLKKLCAVSLSAITVFAAGATGVLPYSEAFSTNVAAFTEEDYFFSFKNEDGGMSITGYWGHQTDLVIPSELKGLPVTEIRHSAFENDEDITSVYIPSSVKKIGNGAFESCPKLRSVVMENGVKEIGIYSFKDCPNLRSITIPDTLEIIDHTAFENTPWFSSLPNGDVYLGKAYFMYKGTLPADSVVKIKKGTTAISERAFYQQSGLKEVYIPEGVTIICEGAFMECKYLKKVSLPSTLKTIENYCFYMNIRLDDIDLPDSVEYIGTHAILFTGWLMGQDDGDVYLNGFYVKHVGDMPENTTVKIKNGTKAILSYAFDECENLSSVIIPSSVKYIGSKAFGKCTSLQHVTVPYGVESIETSVFDGCTSLTSVSLPASNKRIEYCIFGNCTSLTSVTIPYGVVSFNSNSFKNCTSLQSVTIPSTVTNMGYKTFDGCENVTIYGTSDSAAQKYAEENNIPFKTGKAPLASLAVLSADTIELGQSVTVKCYADSGKTPREYAVYYKKESSSKWTVAQKYSTNTKVKITPKAGVVYDVKVKVKDAKGKVAYNTLKLTVKKPLTNTSKLSAYKITLGEKVKIRGSAVGGTGEYQYALYFKKHSQDTYRQIYDYSPKYTVYLQPGAAVKYDIKIDVTDETGKVESKTMLLTVTKT